MLIWSAQKNSALTLSFALFFKTVIGVIIHREPDGPSKH